MKIKLLCMGKIRQPQVAELVDGYARNIGHYYPFELTALPDVRTSRSLSADKQKENEGERFLAEITPQDFVVLFDERGREFTSRGFSEFLERKNMDGVRRAVFIIGGPYGFSKAVYDRADTMMSLSQMTFPHELARLFAVEQLYRAGTIMRGEPYHHD
ncbi:MAG: 23S rRNA (pseudouridine(1915)-N(3))-methyltransferase RlmH [Muribaculaceae bacterium]|nr:23S rRNA (pseudouridine(1915)-N(3))-methyltransferase RlmH [Muribaculaceae bacterium]